MESLIYLEASTRRIINLMRLCVSMTPLSPYSAKGPVAPLQLTVLGRRGVISFSASPASPLSLSGSDVLSTTIGAVTRKRYL